MNERFAVVISSLAIFNFAVLSVYNWIKSKNRPAYFWLGLMSFSAGLAIFDNILIYVGNGSIIAYHLGLSLNILWGAYIIQFINSLRNQQQTKLTIHWILFSPILLYIPFLILTFMKPGLASLTLSLGQHGELTNFGIFYNLLICVYSIGANVFLLVREFRKPSLFDTENKIHTAERKEILGFLLLLQLAAFTPYFFKLDIVYIILYMPVFGQLFFLYVFFRLLSTNVLLQNGKFNLSIKFSKKPDGKYLALKIDEEKSKKICEEIISLMEREKPYLNFEYSLKDMAKDLEINSNILSMILNTNLKSSFPDFINSYRINTSLALLQNSTSRRLTIEAIAFDSGFNNRTSFYKAFKKQTGKLPMDYLKTEIKKKEIV